MIDILDNASVGHLSLTSESSEEVVSKLVVILDSKLVGYLETLTRWTDFLDRTTAVETGINSIKQMNFMLKLVILCITVCE